MDVTCTRCGTTYDFEEGLVSITGTTVKCTQCGHLFKVHRGPETTTLPDPPAELRWRVRRTDGGVHTLDSLSELTKLIGAGQFRRDDEISRTGQVWRRLGDVAELAALFDGSGRPRLRSSDPPPWMAPAPLPVPRERVTTGERRLPDARSQPPESSPPAVRPRRSSGFESMGAPVDLQLPAAPAQSPSSRPPARVALPAPAALPAMPPAPALGSLVHAEPAAAAAAPDAAAEPIASPLPPRPRLWPFVLIVSVLVGGGGALLGTMLTRSPNPGATVRALLLRGDAALAAHRGDRFAQAVDAYLKALEASPDDPHVLSSLSRAYAVFSQALRDQAAAKATPGAAAKPEAQAHALAVQAKLYADRATQHAPESVEAAVTLSDALRLAGKLAPARAALERARARENVPAAETLRVAALLAIDTAHGDLHAGRALAAEAVARDPAMLRTRVLLLRCMAHDGDVPQARAQLAAIRRIDSTHPLLSELARETERAAAQASASTRAHASTATSMQQAAPAPLPAPAAAGAKHVATPEAGANTPQKAATHPSTPAPHASGQPRAAAPSQRAPGSAQDANELAKHGEDLLEAGSVGPAEHAFQRALEIEPGMARANVGLGYVALEHSRPNAAVGLFRAAQQKGSAEALIGLGDAYRRLGRLRPALRAYTTYLEHFPRGPRRSIAQHQIELLKEQLPGGSDPAATGSGH